MTTREQLIEAIGKPIHDMRYNAAQYSTIEIAEAVRVAIEAAGLCIVPREATEAMLDDGEAAYELAMHKLDGLKASGSCYRAMIAAGKL